MKNCGMMTSGTGVFDSFHMKELTEEDMRLEIPKSKDFKQEDSRQQDLSGSQNAGDPALSP